MLDLVLADPGAGPSERTSRLVNTWHDDSGRVFARAFVCGPRRWIDWPGLGRFEFSLHTSAVILHGTDANGLARAGDTFRRLLQPVILQARGLEALHASAATGPCGALVFAGTSGHGKSTLACSIARRPGFQQLADDAVVLDGLVGASAVVVRPLPFRTRLRAASEAALGAVDAPMSAGDVRRDPPVLRAIVLLEQAFDAPAMARPVRIPPHAAFAAVLTHAYCFDEHDPIERERMVRHYLHVVDVVPVFTLRYRPDFALLDVLIDGVMAAMATDRRAV